MALNLLVPSFGVKTAWSAIGDIRLLAAFNVVFFRVSDHGVLYLASGTAAVLEYLQPMLVGLLAWMVLGESLSLAKIFGLTLGFSGIVAVSSGSIFGNTSPAGVAFGAGSAFSWALGTVFFKRYEARISTMWAVAIPFVIGGMVLTLFGFAIESWSEVSPTATLFASLSYVSLVEIALAWLIWFGLVRTGEASRAGGKSLRRRSISRCMSGASSRTGATRSRRCSLSASTATG